MRTLTLFRFSAVLAAAFCTLAAAVLVATLPVQAQFGAPEPQAPLAQPVPPAKPAPSGSTLIVPAGERLVLELETPLHTRVTKVNDTAEFVTHRDLVVGRRVVVPRGSYVRATVTKAKRPGRLKGRGEIQLRFDELELPDGTIIPFTANLLRAGFTEVKDGKLEEADLEGDGSKVQDILVVAQGGMQGVLIGGAIGGRKGAAYGSAIGAGIGLVGMLLRRGPDLDLPRGMLFEVEINQEIPVPAAATTQLAARPLSLTRAYEKEEPDEEWENFRFPDLDAVPGEREDGEAIPDFEETETAEAPGAKAPPADGTVPPPVTAPVPPPEVPAPPLGDDYTIKVDVSLVTMETVVRDPAGRGMDHLKRKDFRIFEDGVEQKIRHFSRDELPLAVALVVDRSGSVAPFMSELRRAAYQTLTQLKPGDLVALFSFASDTDRLVGLTTDRRRVAERIARIRPGGGTNIIDSLVEAADYLARNAPDRRRAIILISDNDITVRSRNDRDTLLRFVLETETVVYSVKTPGAGGSGGLQLSVFKFGKNPVKEITRESGGEIIDVRKQRSISQAMEIVISRLKLRYTLGYVSSNKSRDGRFRRVEIQLSERFGEFQRNYSTHHRRGYYTVSGDSSAQTQP